MTFGNYNLQQGSKTETQLFTIVEITHFCGAKERHFYICIISETNSLIRCFMHYICTHGLFAQVFHRIPFFNHFQLPLCRKIKSKYMLITFTHVCGLQYLNAVSMHNMPNVNYFELHLCNHYFFSWLEGRTKGIVCLLQPADEGPIFYILSLCLTHCSLHLFCFPARCLTDALTMPLFFRWTLTMIA